MSATVAVLKGDGIGPEVVDAAMAVLTACVPVQLLYGVIGGEAIDAVGDPLPAATIEVCRRADAVFFGAVGGTHWGGPGRAEEAVSSEWGV